jgi:proteasome lid subunit RPN8/RPN11
MRLTREQAEELIVHAREDAPNECCGMIGGKDGEATTVYRATNAEASPLRYNLDPQDQFKIMMTMEEEAEDLVAIYHSHTKSPAYRLAVGRRGAGAGLQDRGRKGRGSRPLRTGLLAAAYG